jgi:cholesterol transport system auxiliary component
MSLINTIKSIARRADSMPASGQNTLNSWLKTGRAGRSLIALGAAALLLSACATPQPPAPKTVYDFGAVLAVPSAVLPASTQRSAAVALPEIEAGAGLDSPALLYRFQYADAQQLRPYTQARWSVPPAQLVRARLRDALAAQGPVLTIEGATPWVLRVELDEFSQLFEAPSSSFGLVRLRVNLLKNDQLHAQTSVLARSAAPTQDAAGGVRALTAATDDAVRQIATWLAANLK